MIHRSPPRYRFLYNRSSDPVTLTVLCKGVLKGVFEQYKGGWALRNDLPGFPEKEFTRAIG